MCQTVKPKTSDNISKMSVIPSTRTQNHTTKSVHFKQEPSIQKLPTQDLTQNPELPERRGFLKDQLQVPRLTDRLSTFPRGRISPPLMRLISLSDLLIRHLFVFGLRFCHLPISLRIFRGQFKWKGVLVVLGVSRVINKVLCSRLVRL